MRVSTVNVHLGEEQVDNFIPDHGVTAASWDGTPTGWVSVGPVGFFGTLPELRQLATEILAAVDEMEKEVNPFALY